jgi:dihydrolipoamide dehydrogenase
MDQPTYDLIIVGAGPGGYVAAERAGHRGLKTLIVEKSHLGGVCLNEGCIPSKTLLYSAKLFHHATHGAAYGVVAEKVSFDLATVMKRKTKVIETLRKGVEFQMNRNQVTVVKGVAKLLDRQRVEVNGQTYAGKNIMLATGSAPIRPPLPGADQPHVLTSSEIFDIKELPKRLVIVGGGVIGMEFACFFSHVGVDVTVVEMLPEILPPYDPELAVGLRRALKHVTYQLGCKVEKIGANDVTFSQDGKATTIPADLVLLSIGRRPNTQGLGLDTAGVDCDKGGIKVNERLETNLPGVFAVGDVNGKSQLAHSASRMGEVVVNNLTGRPDRMRYHAIPYVVYTFPDVAAVGLTAAQAEAQGRRVASFKLPMSANGRHLAEHEQPQGFVKAVVDADSRVLLGLHMLGDYAAELIATCAAMIEAELRVADIRDIVFPHPTVAETMRDAIWELPL